LNKDHEGFMVLELDYSFSCFLLDSFSRFFLSPVVPFDLISKFEPPNERSDLAC